MQAQLLLAAYIVIHNTSLVETEDGESDVKGRVGNDEGSFIYELVGVLEELRTS
jgi:hypothetical protein